MKMQEKIAKVAYELYEKSGRLEGRALQNWLEAERIVMSRHGERKISAAKAAPVPRKKKAATAKMSSKFL